MSPADESKLLTVSPATLADLYEQLGSSNTRLDGICDRLEETNKRLGGLSCVVHAERLAALEAAAIARGERVARLEAKSNGVGDRLSAAEQRLEDQAIHDEDTGQAARTYREGTADQRSPSNLYRAVGAKIEQRGEEVTERIKLEAIVAAQQAVDKQIAERAEQEAARLKRLAETEAARLKQESDQKLAEIDLRHKEMELQHKRSMSRVKVFGAVLAALVASGIFATIRGLLGNEAAQVETARTLKRIEAKQSKPVVVRPPDVGVEP